MFLQTPGFQPSEQRFQQQDVVGVRSDFQWRPFTVDILVKFLQAPGFQPSEQRFQQQDGGGCEDAGPHVVEGNDEGSGEVHESA